MSVHPPTARLVTARLLTVGLAASLALVTFVAPSSAHGNHCRVIDTEGMTVQAARTELGRRGCLPGAKQDGRHFIVKNRCEPIENFGLVVDQRPPGGTLRHGQVLILWRGIRQTDAICGQLPDPVDTTANDGHYVGAYTVTVTSDSTLYPVGGQVTGIAFDVTNGRITGDVTGVIVGGASGGASYDIADTACAAPAPGLTFGNGLAHAAGVVCRDGEDQTTGDFTAWRQ
jgi:hypothetical protein